MKLKKFFSFLLVTAGLFAPSLQSLAYGEGITKFAIDETKEVTLASSELGGQTLVATDVAGAYVMSNEGAQNMVKNSISAADFTKLSYRFEFTKVNETIMKDDAEVTGDLYVIRLLNDAGNAYAIWGSQGYIGDAGWVIYTLRNGKTNAAEDADYLQGIWKVAYDAENGYTIQNVNSNRYLSIADGNGSNDVKYIRLFTGLGTTTYHYHTFTPDLWKTWDGVDENAQVTGNANVPVNLRADVAAGGLVAGGNVPWNTYADLTNYSGFHVKGTASMSLRLLFNRQKKDDGGDGDYIEITQVIPASGELDIDFATLTKDENLVFPAGTKYIHLNSIKVNWGSPTGQIEELYLSFNFPYNETAADITTFALDDAKCYDKEEGKFGTEGDKGWVFDTPVNLSSHKWLVVTTTYNARSTGGRFTVTDDNGNSMGGDEYKCDGRRGSMWLDAWNNRFCAAVNLPYLAEQGIDITKIKSLTFSNNHPVSAVFLTNDEEGKAVADKSGYGGFNGDHVREYNAGNYDNTTPNPAKFGTVCLPYAAAVTGAYIYEIQEFSESWGMSLSRHYGVMEAGKPYFYLANDPVGEEYDDNGEKKYRCNVQFVRVDANEVADPVSGNGLVGTFTGVDSGLDGKYILLTEDNKLHKINGATVTVGANRCYIDPDKYEAPTEARAAVSFGIADGEEATAISSINSKLSESNTIYDLQGRAVRSMQKGHIYVVGGMKVYIK